jgi:hypothetical protein
MKCVRRTRRGGGTVDTTRESGAVMFVLVNSSHFWQKPDSITARRRERNDISCKLIINDIRTFAVLLALH